MSPAFSIKILNASFLAALDQCTASGLHVTEDHYFLRALAEQDAGKRVVFVAWDKGRVAGYVHVNHHPLYKPFARLAIAEIQDLFVHPDFRGVGLGRLLVGACEDYVRAQGGAEIGIGVGVTPEFGIAQRLYVRLGYVPDGAGVVFEREGITSGTLKPLDDRLCLMLTKPLV